MCVLQLADVCRCMDVLIKQAAQQVNMRFMEKTGFNFQALQQQELLDPVPQYVYISCNKLPLFFAFRSH